AMFVFTIGLSLWSANAGMKALFDALNIVYIAEERRGLIKLNAVSLAFTAGALLVLLLAMAAIVVLPVALEYAGLQTIGGSIVMLARWPALFAALALTGCMPSGTGSLGAAVWRRFFGLSRRFCSPGTRPILATTTRLTGRSAQRSAS